MSAKKLTLRTFVRFPAFALDVDTRLAISGVTALFGPSGSGKSTLLRCIAGFESPSDGFVGWDGDVWFDDAAKINQAPHRRPIGFMFQDARLFEHLNVAANLDFAVKRRRGAASYDRAEIIAALDLEPLLRRATHSLSGGERQRVALGRTLLTSPQLLLLDEPLAALDRDRKADILPYLEALPRRFNIPTIYVSHDIDEIARLADSVLVLAEGKIQTHGPTATVIEQLDLDTLVDRFEAGVLVEGQIIGHDPRLHLTTLDLNGDTLSMPLLEHIAPGSTIRVRIRSRDVAIALQRPQGLSIRNILAGRITALVDDIEPGTVVVDIELSGSRVRARITRAALDELDLKVGLDVFALIKSVSFSRDA